MGDEKELNTERAEHTEHTERSYALDLRICHGNATCVAMKHDLRAAEEHIPTREQTARLLTAVHTGQCTYCGRRVR